MTNEEFQSLVVHELKEMKGQLKEMKGQLNGRVSRGRQTALKPQ